MDGTQRGARLAARIKASLDLAASAEQARLDAARLRRERGQRERAAVLSDLASFCEALGHFQCQRGNDGSVTWSHGGRLLTFKPVGDADRVDLVSEALSGESSLRWQHELSRWVMVEGFKVGGERQRLLFDEALEVLLLKVFALRPVPEGELPDPPDGATLDDAMPTARTRNL